MGKIKGVAGVTTNLDAMRRNNPSKPTNAMRPSE